ncbi:MAG: hypothetical protein O2794_02765 [bacterium]|nr:hypothetical protein [bacterium]
MAISESQLAQNAKASQEIVPIEEIRDGVVVLKDGSLRGVLMASSLNFALKSPDEQDAIILQYQSFLNSLDFSVEFSIQSRRLNIEPYLEILRTRKKEEVNELLRIQITEYITFVKEFVETGNIVTKTFYIVVSFTPNALSGAQQQGIMQTVKTIFGGNKNTDGTIDQVKFEEYKTQLYQRVDTVISGLVRTGVRAVPLNTEELIELYYSLYNPESSGKGKAPQITEGSQLGDNQ